MTMRRKARYLALPAAAAAIYLSITATATAYTVTFRLPMTVQVVWMDTISIFCKNVFWRGTVNSGQTLTLNSGGICLVKSITVAGLFEGTHIQFDLPGISTAALPQMQGLSYYDKDGKLCLSGQCDWPLRSLFVVPRPLVR